MRNRNVVMLVTHDTGRHISPYGVDTVVTPNCQSLAEEGVLFTQAFCTAPQCSPSRAALFTGQYPHENGVMGLSHGYEETSTEYFGWDLVAPEHHASHLFRGAGYHTGLLGFQHETSYPERLGFDCVDVRFPLSAARDHLRKFLAERPAGRPFYCQIGCDETHRPFDMHGTEPYDLDGVYVPPYLTDGPETRAEFAAFQGLVNSFDKSLGAIVEELKSAGVWNNTIFILTTDHGIAMPRSKCTLFDPGISTMLIFRVPDGPTAAVNDDLISNVDILPTILELCSIPVPEWASGQSFAGVFTGIGSEQRSAVFAEKTYHSLYDPLRCIRTDRYKYIHHFENIKYFEVPGDIRRRGAHNELSRELDGPVPMIQLFDLHEDPLETRNLADDPGLATVRRDLQKSLMYWLQNTSDPILDGPIASPRYRLAVDSLAGSQANPGEVRQPR